MVLQPGRSCGVTEGLTVASPSGEGDSQGHTRRLWAGSAGGSGWMLRRRNKEGGSCSPAQGDTSPIFLQELRSVHGVCWGS